MDVLRGRAYVWASWLPKLLVGEDRCWYKLWFKARHKYDRVPDDPERASFFAEWTARHAEIVRWRADELRAEGYVVRVEKDAKFHLAGDSADLAGEPDIAALKGREALIVEAKAGRRRASDVWQALIYMFAYPLAGLQGTDCQVRGEVQYRDGAVEVPPLTTRERGSIVAAIQAASRPEVPAAEPSVEECRYCDIASCPYRARAAEPGDARGLF